MNWLHKLPWPLILIACSFVMLAPFVPEPHLWQKMKMLLAGTLNKPIDIIDVVWHSWPVIIIVLKIVAGLKQGKKQPPAA